MELIVEKSLTIQEKRDKEYAEFLAKFDTNAPKTSDDCYTPRVIYDAVLEWVAREYNINLDTTPIIRPFYPSGNYQAETYPANCIVVDNPPFSILTQIIDFYLLKGIRFFLFAPALTLGNSVHTRYGVTAVVAKITIVYENGAQVATSFVTNLDDPEIIMRTAPQLWRVLKAAHDISLQQRKQTKAKRAKNPNDTRALPPQVIHSAKLTLRPLQRADFHLKRSEVHPIGGLDAQRREKGTRKCIFGGGFLVSEQAAARYAEAYKEGERILLEQSSGTRGTQWELSAREKQIVAELTHGRDLFSDL